MMLKGEKQEMSCQLSNLAYNEHCELRISSSPTKATSVAVIQLGRNAKLRREACS